MVRCVRLNALESLTIVAPDKIGLLLDVTTILGKERINIESISLEVVGRKAVMRLLIEKARIRKAKESLERKGFNVVASDTFVVKLADRPGELAKVAKVLAENGVAVESVHIIDKQNGMLLNALKVDKPEKGEKLLKKYF